MSSNKQPVALCLILRTMVLGTTVRGKQAPAILPYVLPPSLNINLLNSTVEIWADCLPHFSMQSIEFLCLLGKA